ncbi:MAG: DNA replication/repair protein RecF [Panacagrimonas sp.]
MAVALLRGENFRLYRSLQIEPHPQLNLIIGDNAAGKTTLLEALFVTARGRSFRAQNLGELKGPVSQAWNAFVEVRTNDIRRRIGVGWTRDGMEMRLDEEKNARVSEIVRTVPLQLIDPLAHRLLDEGPAYRRSFVDWGVFHVEHQFLDTWRRYQRALRQRNAALREDVGVKAVEAWNEELATSGESLTRMRELHVVATARAFSLWAEKLLGVQGATAEWQRGWPTDENYRETLERNLEQHRKLGTTVQGPHRAELKISLADVKAKGRVSRGQQKMLISAMVLAQADLLIGEGVPAPILLLDDFSSELAPEFQTRLAEALIAYRGQKFITAFEVPAGFAESETHMFHVEQGTVRATNRLH